jgi:hypothetical protein
MSSKSSGSNAATSIVREAEAIEAWPPDQPIPYSLTPYAQAMLSLDDPEAEADPC